MNAEFIPKITLNVEFMKGSMVHAMGLAGSDVEKHIAAAIDEQLKNIDYDRIILEHLSTAVSSAVKDHFSYGEGRKAIEKAVQGMFKKNKNPS